MTGADADGPWHLVVAGPAARAISDELPAPVAAAVIELITGPLVTDPHRMGRELRNELSGMHAARRGAFRVLYRIEEDRRQVVVLRVQHRRDAYRP